ncbi:MAG: nucleotidyltransferase [Candidatus Brocadiae bacterium]|nr:nucleotidyltransferase [Candidatus Brocadiia bacterium]
MNSLTLVILAAGMGSRYGGIKQIEGLGPKGEIFSDYSVAYAKKAGFQRILLIIRKDIEQYFYPIVERWQKNFGLPIDFCYQEMDSLPTGFSSLHEKRKKPWGTGHAVLCAANQISTPFAVINADDFYGETSYRILAEFLRNIPKNSTQHAMVAFLLQNTLSPYGTVSRGICKTEGKDYLKEVTECTRLSLKENKVYNSDILLPDAGPNSPVSMNFWGFSPSIFPWIEQQFCEFLQKEKDLEKAEFYIPKFVDNGIKTAKFTVKVLESQEKWAGVTYREDLDWVKKILPALF